MDENIPRPEHYSQVCVWPGTIVNEDEISELESFFLEAMGTRVKYLETIITKPDIGFGGMEVLETGGRHDVFFAVHEEDIHKFSLARLRYGIRWIEDVLAPINGYGDNPIYPERVFEYKTW